MNLWMRLVWLVALFLGYALGGKDLTRACTNHRACGPVALEDDASTSSNSKSDTATQSRLTIHIPFDLHSAQGEDHVKADYGYTSKSGSIAAYVYYVERSLCARLHFNRSSAEEAGWPTHTGARKSPYIIMAPMDSDCHSVLQVRNAQMDGAAALVFAHQGCRCSDKNCTQAYGPDCVDHDIHLTTDGSSLDVSIPSVLLYKPKAQALIAQLKKDQPVLMEITWGIPHVPNESGAKKQVGPVHAELWMTAHDPIAELDTIQEFAALSKHFHEAAIVAPRYALIDGSRFNCNHQVDNGGPCDHLCTNHGRYCALQSSTGISGQQVVGETLRRLCIWQHYGDWRDEASATTSKDVKTTTAYWDYLTYHRENCYSAEEFANTDCIKKAYKAGSVDGGTIDTCMQESGGLHTDADNSILGRALTSQRRDGVVSVPSIVVDRNALDGLSSYRLFYAICDPYFESGDYGVVPDLCEKCWDCTNVIGCITQGGKCVHEDYSKEHNKKMAGNGHTKKNHTFLRFLGWMIFLGVSAGGGYHLYQTRFNDAGGFSGRVGGGGFYTQLVGGGAD